jgi:hypothetical protein
MCVVRATELGILEHPEEERDVLMLRRSFDSAHVYGLGSTFIMNVACSQVLQNALQGSSVSQIGGCLHGFVCMRRVLRRVGFRVTDGCATS